MATSALIPNLAAQNIDYLRNAVEQYRSGVRDVAAMRAALGMVSKTEVDAILQWYSRQTPDSTK